MVATKTTATLLAICIAPPSIAADCTTFDAFDGKEELAKKPAEAECTNYLTSNTTTGTSCHWSFKFRNADARIFADDLWNTLTTCRPGAVRGADQLVNHPDSYDLREWKVPTGTYAISVKDKGALNRTLVFLRFEPD